MTDDRPAEARAPDLVQPVIGYRLWRLGDDALFSPYVEERWARGVHTAVCRAERGDHPGPAPAHECSCGIHAWYEPCPTLSWAATRHLVAGAIALWGDIELHPFGMRAAQGMIVALALPPWNGPKPRRIVEMARMLEVEAVPARRLEAVALEHGAPIPDGMAPEPRASRAAYAVEQRLAEARREDRWRPSSLVSRTRSPD
jgi:hypothetical protein